MREFMTKNDLQELEINVSSQQDVAILATELKKDEGLFVYKSEKPVVSYYCVIYQI